jgi:hypothetical protein
MLRVEKQSRGKYDSGQGNTLGGRDAEEHVLHKKGIDQDDE